MSDILMPLMKKAGAAQTAPPRHRRNELPCTPNLYTLEQALAILADPVRDMRYLETALGPVIQEYLRWKRLANGSQVTLDSYERILARLAVRLPDGVGIAQVGVEHLMLALDEVPAGSWRLHRAAYNGLFKWAIERDRRSAKNPVGLLPGMRPEPPPVYDVFNETERALILAAAELMDDPPRDLARAHLLLDAGIRRGGACGMLQQDVDAVNRQVKVVEKGKKERLIPIDEEDFWLAWERQQFEPYPRLLRMPEPTDYIWFPARVAGAYKNRARQVTAEYPERPMLPRGWHSWWTRLIGHSGIAYRKPHMSRHTFATDLLEATDGDLYAVKEMLGHSSTRVTEVYLHSSSKRKASAAAKLAAARRRKPQ